MSRTPTKLTRAQMEERRLDEGGKRALRRATAPGRPCKLTREQELFGLLDAGAFTLSLLK